MPLTNSFLVSKLSNSTGSQSQCGKGRLAGALLSASLPQSVDGQETTFSQELRQDPSHEPGSRPGQEELKTRGPNRAFYPPLRLWWEKLVDFI